MSTAPIPTFQPVVGFSGPLPEPSQWRPPAERILAGDPVQRTWNLYSSTDGRFHAGIWECAPGRWRVAFSESEFCHLLAGRIVVSGDDGSVQSYGAGDAFVSPAGFTGSWEVLEPARKYYAIYE
jgi:uncharacterized protein